jgi:uncharacterized phage-associated protein
MQANSPLQYQHHIPGSLQNHELIKKYKLAPNKFSNNLFFSNLHARYRKFLSLTIRKMATNIEIKLKGYSNEQLERLGNTILFLIEKIQPLYKTKLLKLIYLLDELSTFRNGIPFLGLEYKIWQAGPVNSDLYEEFNQPYLLDSFIQLEQDAKGVKVLAKKRFSDEEFSEMEINLLTEIANRYKTTPAEKLVEITHRKSAPWYIIAEENNLLEAFESKKINTTDIPLDFTLLIKDDAQKMAMYNENIEVQKFSKFLRS